MRKRNSLIGIVLGVVGLASLAGIASATDPDTTLTSIAAPSKQSATKFGGITLNTTLDTNFTTGDIVPPGSATCNGSTNFSSCKYFPPATRTTLDFDDGFKFRTGPRLHQCAASPATLSTLDTAGAKAACGPKTQVGQGDALIKTVSDTSIPATVTAFNGAPQNGHLTIYLHADNPTASSPTLVGELKPSPLGGDFGTQLDIDVPVTPGTAIVHFNTKVNKIVVKKIVKKNKKTGKKKVIRKFYASMRCADKNRKLNVRSTSYYSDYAGNPRPADTDIANSVQKCQVS